MDPYFIAYGLLIAGLALMARSVFLIPPSMRSRSRRDA
jgi:hypothetical protein